ncbi:MAG: hypothetical protein PHE24_01315 [Patescibacteria group bacterium]|nr:hypothetical protein [Patescibacteria group bacterium]
MNQFFKKIIFIAVILALVFGFAYSICQQVLRQGANDPQIQIARDAAVKLALGEGPDYYRSDVYGQVDIAKSLSPFLMTFDGSRNVLSTNATLNGKAAVPPAGVFAYAKKHGENRVTWQPAKGVRIAAVMVHYSGVGEGYALSGRSLAEVEKRSGSLEFLTFWVWLFSVIVSAVLIFVGEKNVVPARRFN